jgi:hypothetical protein
MLRILLGDKRLIGDIEFTKGVYVENSLIYLRYSPETDIEWNSDNALPRKCAVPKHLKLVTGIELSCPIIYIQEFNEWMINSKIPLNKNMCKLVDEVDRFTLLNETLIKRWFSERPGKLKLGFRLFFQEDYSKHHLYNTFLFLSFYLSMNRKNGKLQSKIPLEVSNKLNIDRVSLVQMDIAIDILCLIYNGLVSVNKDDKLKELVVAFQNDPRSSKRRFNWLKDGVFMLNGELAESTLRSYTSREMGTFGSSYYLNISRLLNKNKKIQAFKPYYEAIDEEALCRFILNHFKNLSLGFSELLKEYLKSRKYTLIQIRDISNVLFYVWHLRKIGMITSELKGHYYLFLPSAAKFLCGEKEYNSNGNGGSSLSDANKKQNKIETKRLDAIESFNRIEIIKKVKESLPHIKNNGFEEIVRKTIEIVHSVGE